MHIFVFGHLEEGFDSVDGRKLGAALNRNKDLLDRVYFALFVLERDLDHQLGLLKGRGHLEGDTTLLDGV